MIHAPDQVWGQKIFGEGLYCRYVRGDISSFTIYQYLHPPTMGKVGRARWDGHEMMRFFHQYQNHQNFLNLSVTFLLNKRLIHISNFFLFPRLTCPVNPFSSHARSSC